MTVRHNFEMSNGTTQGLSQPNLV